ncbi:MAG: SulP family inorganic anion transporter, partial [Actinomycetota bacterium]|nr:SulP family inorganic anion transporter [Actinomycetota bacterium]
MSWRRRAGSHAGDLVGGISAAFVLIPQALAYAILAGMPAERGLYVAGLAPVAAAFFASSPYLGTGPTALSSLLTFGALTALATPGSETYIGLAALLALLVGAVRTLMGLARLGAVSYLISEPVLAGFTTGAAVVIIASQVPTVLDAPATAINPFAAAFDALSRPGDWHGPAIAVSLVTAAVIVGGRRIHQLFPSVLVAVLGAIGFTVWVGYDGDVVGAVEGGIPPFSLDLPWSELPSLLVPALVIAVVGFTEPAS